MSVQFVSAPNNVRDARVKRGWNQTQLAAKAGVGGQSIVSAAERGLAGPSVRKRLAKALRKSERELFPA